MKERKMKTKNEKEKKPVVEGNVCYDKDCPFHGNLKNRGKIFEGIIIKKFPRRVVIEFERVVYIRKYERYIKRKTKIHARVPDCMKEKIKIGDLIRVQECRPLSKLIHFVIIEKIKDGKDEKK